MMHPPSLLQKRIEELPELKRLSSEQAQLLYVCALLRRDPSLDPESVDPSLLKDVILGLAPDHEIDVQEIILTLRRSTYLADFHVEVTALFTGDVAPSPPSSTSSSRSGSISSVNLTSGFEALHRRHLSASSFSSLESLVYSPDSRPRHRKTLSASSSSSSESFYLPDLILRKRNSTSSLPPLSACHPPIKIRKKLKSPLGRAKFTTPAPPISREEKLPATFPLAQPRPGLERSSSSSSSASAPPLDKDKFQQQLRRPLPHFGSLRNGMYREGRKLSPCSVSSCDATGGSSPLSSYSSSSSYGYETGDGSPKAVNRDVDGGPQTIDEEKSYSVERC